jgi:hypothetical protein
LTQKRINEFLYVSISALLDEDEKNAFIGIYPVRTAQDQQAFKKCC